VVAGVRLSEVVGGGLGGRLVLLRLGLGRALALINPTLPTFFIG
jgi:hypothetical protein